VRELHFTVPGPPKGKPAARASAYTPKGGGRPRARTYNSDAAERLLEAIAGAARAALAEGEPFAGPVRLIIVAHVSPPASTSDWKRDAMLADRIRPTCKFDCDNLAKGIADGITRAGVWSDDAQVVYLSVQKRYREEPLTRVCVSEVAAHGTSATRAEVEEEA